MTAEIRIAVAGVGLVGRRHVDAIARTAGAVLAGVVDPSEEGRAYADANGLRHFDTLEELLRAQVTDGVILSTPTPLHVEQAQACVAQGLPVLVEKPLATSAEAAAVLVAEAERKEVPILVGHHRRHNPLIRKAWELIDAGEIGQVRAVQATSWFYKPDGYFEVAPWRKQKGAGPISVNLVHDVDLMRHLCGEVISVQAQATPSLRGFENEDVAAAVFRFENGGIGTITVSDSIVAPWSWELTSQEYPIYPRTSESCYLIGGSHGALSLPDLRLWRHGGERDWWSPISATSMVRESSDPLLNQITHFAAVIRGEEAPLVSGREGLRTLRVVEAIQASAETGTTVTISRD
ncbi:Gfo/Idh/MocA family protein [Aliiruegeria lutimaris]|uniref:Predicted dehydrogenase n=1 Tax=Aliiruegeria lutimaris TaxID=571298 RepID=A0A1G8SL73_9RHOB|nr:Gfo/Idh/MocA family oxidoreductase [Aliiruegeria lutimaris]SDJ29903.1 Predicted dehydrogenase [Aliiruegeria lutimaris]